MQKYTSPTSTPTSASEGLWLRTSSVSVVHSVTSCLRFTQLFSVFLLFAYFHEGSMTTLHILNRVFADFRNYLSIFFWVRCCGIFSMVHFYSLKDVQMLSHDIFSDVKLYRQKYRQRSTSIFSVKKKPNGSQKGRKETERSEVDLTSPKMSSVLVLLRYYIAIFSIKSKVVIKDILIKNIYKIITFSKEER